MSGMDRRGFFGRLAGGFLAAVGLRAAEQEGWGFGGVVYGPDGVKYTDDWSAGTTTLKKGDIITIEGYFLPNGEYREFVAYDEGER